MKTYEKMARDALQRIDEENGKRRAHCRNIIRFSVAVGCAALAVFVGVGIPFLVEKEQSLPSNSMVKPITTSVLQVAYLSENGWDCTVMKEQIETQMRYKLSVVDTRGMTAAQREKLRQEMVAKQEEELLKLYPEIYSEYASGGVGVNSAWDNVLFMMCRVGEFQLDINEEKMVKSIRAECSSVYSEVEFCLHSVDLVGQKVAYRAKWADTEEHL